MHLRFADTLECRRFGALPGVTLVGRTPEGDALYVSLLGDVPADLPPTLPSAKVESMDGERYRISSGARAWTFSARLFLHHDLSAAFYQALPPAPVPLLKRTFWRLVLATARTRLGERWLARSRG